jgi:copper resistance protein D
MPLLVEFFDVFLLGADFLALALAVGGVFFALAVLRPWRPLTIMGRMALRQSARLIILGSGGVILIQTLRLLLQFLTFVNGIGEGVLTQFLATNFAQGGRSVLWWLWGLPL